MPNHKKYLLTVDQDTGAPVRLEHVGESGELTELPLSHLQIPMAAPQTPGVVIHVYGGTVATTPPTSSTPTASIIHAAAPPSIIHQPAASIIHKEEPTTDEDK